MRILIPNHRAPDTFVDNVAHTLEQLGHAVFTLPVGRTHELRTRLGRARESAMRRLVRGYVTSREHHALAIAREVRPEMVLALTQELAPQTLRDLKKIGVRHRVAWWGDAPANMYMGLLDDEWDLLFAKDAECVRKLRRVGLNAHLLHEAHNPSWHRPVARVANDNVVVAGNFYAYRQFLVRRLVDRGVPLELYGGPLPRWVDAEIEKRHLRRHVTREEKSRVFGEGLACLNSMHMVEGDALNCRAFEIAGAAGLQLIEYRPMIASCFEPGKEVLGFDSLAELLDHIERARKYPAEAAQIREAGHRRALLEHTYAHRLALIFELIEQR